MSAIAWLRNGLIVSMLLRFHLRTFRDICTLARSPCTRRYLPRELQEILNNAWSTVVHVSAILALDEQMVLDVSRAGSGLQRFNEKKPIKRGKTVASFERLVRAEWSPMPRNSLKTLVEFRNKVRPTRCDRPLYPNDIYIAVFRAQSRRRYLHSQC